MRSTGIEYTCPMHPEVLSDRPGDCPKCGMALEPKTMAVDRGAEDSEVRSLSRKLWIAAALTLPVFFAKAWRSLKSMNLNMFTLIATGVGTAYT
jgi:cation transport ATPase